MYIFVTNYDLQLHEMVSSLVLYVKKQGQGGKDWW